MNIYSIFGPTINYNTSQNRTRRDPFSPINFLSSIFSQEVNEILQQHISPSTTNQGTSTTNQGTTTINQETTTQNQQQVEEVLFFFEPLNQTSTENQGVSLSQMRDISSIEPNENSEEEKICVICHQQIELNQIIRKLNSCSHEFHVHCIDEWLSSHSSCPTCRQNLIEDTEPAQQPTRRSPFYQFRYGRDRTT